MPRYKSPLSSDPWTRAENERLMIAIVVLAIAIGLAWLLE